MRKIVEVKIIKPFTLRCIFDNGEIKDIMLEKYAHQGGKHFRNILDESVFVKVQIGKHGELVWKEQAEIKDYDGSFMLCDFDISPEFVYLNSEPIMDSHYSQ